MREPAPSTADRRRAPFESRHTCHSRRSISDPISQRRPTTARRRTMTKHMTGTREEWLAARLELLRGGEGADAARRRAGAAAPGAALGPDRQDLSLRDRGRQRLAGGSLPRALAAPRLPLHVRARLHGRMRVVLVDRRRLRRLRRSPGEPRRRPDGGVAGAARQAAGLQAADGVDVSLGVLGRQRLQLRLQRRVHRGAAARRHCRLQLPARRPRDGHHTGPGRRSSSSRRPPEPTRPPMRSTGRA